MTSQEKKYCNKCGKGFTIREGETGQGFGIRNHCSKACRYSNMAKGTVKSRFWDRVKKNKKNGCWEWTGAVCSKQRLTFGVGVGSKRRIISANRLCYQLEIKELLKSERLFAICKNPMCVNPHHAEIITASELRKRRHKDGVYPFGEDIWNSKLTAESVVEIRDAYKDGETMTSLSKKHCVSLSIVSLVISRKRWGHVK